MDRRLRNNARITLVVRYFNAHVRFDVRQEVRNQWRGGHGGSTEPVFRNTFGTPVSDTKKNFRPKVQPFADLRRYGLPDFVNRYV
jgi:hypothetical protein